VRKVILLLTLISTLSLPPALSSASTSLAPSLIKNIENKLVTDANIFSGRALATMKTNPQTSFIKALTSNISTLPNIAAQLQVKFTYQKNSLTITSNFIPTENITLNYINSNLSYSSTSFTPPEPSPNIYITGSAVTLSNQNIYTLGKSVFQTLINELPNNPHPTINNLHQAFLTTNLPLDLSSSFYKNQLRIWNPTYAFASVTVAISNSNITLTTSGIFPAPSNLIKDL